MQIYAFIFANMQDICKFSKKCHNMYIYRQIDKQDLRWTCIICEYAYAQLCQCTRYVLQNYVLKRQMHLSQVFLGRFGSFESLLISLKNIQFVIRNLTRNLTIIRVRIYVDTRNRIHLSFPRIFFLCGFFVFCVSCFIYEKRQSLYR